MQAVEKLSVRGVLGDAWILVGLHWRQMFVYSLMIWFCSATILGPLTSWILHSLATNGDVIVGNYSLPSWLLTPKGMTYFFLAGSVSLFSLFLQVTGLFLIVRRSQKQVLLKPASMLRHNLSVLPSLLWFCLNLFIRLIPVALLLAVVPGVLFLLFLREHDVNFYMTSKPAEWFWVLGLSGLWALVWLVGLLYLMMRWVYALPSWLEGLRPVRKVFRDSWGNTRALSPFLFKIVCSFSAVWICVVGVVMGGLFLTISLALRLAADSMKAVIGIMVVYLILKALLQVLLTFFGTAWVASIWSLCFRRHVPVGGTHDLVSASSLSIRWFKFFHLKLFSAIAVFLFSVSLIASSTLLDKEIPLKIPLIIAHRAGPVYAPENTLAGLDRVLNDGFSDFVEIDVELTADGVVVCAHDKDLMKLADSDAIINETNYEDLLKIDIGKKFGIEFEGEQLGRLDEFLDRTKDKVQLMVEFKYVEDTTLIEDTIELIRERHMEDQVVLMSLELTDVRTAQTLAPDIKVGYFATLETGDLAQLEVDFIGVKDWLAQPELIKEIQEKNIPIYSWTVNEPIRMVELIEAGIDGIITNDPPLAHKVVNKAKSLSSDQRILLKFRPFWKVLKKMGLWKSDADPLVEAE